MKKYPLIFFLILLIASFLRFFKLEQIPISVTDDEVRLAYSAFSIWNTGKDLNGSILPLAFIIDGYAFNPMAIYLTSPLVGLFGLSIFFSRLPFAIAGLLSIVLTYFISNKLFKNKIISILSIFAMTFSAWHLQISRFAYEGGFALFFFLLGIYIFLLVSKNKYIMLYLSLFIFLLAFNSYSGTKLILVPVLLMLTWYKYKDLVKKQIIIIFLGIILIFFSFFLLVKFQNAASYGGMQFFFQDSQATSQSVELERRASLAPTNIEKLYHNKLTYWSGIFLNHYLYAYSPQYLFINQEASGIFSMWHRGQLFLIEFPIIFVGALYILKKKKREFILLFSFLLIAPLPSGLGANPITYTIRSSFMIPWLMLFIGAGIYSAFHSIKNKSIKICFGILLLILYIYSIGGYLNQYYYEWMRYGSKYYSKGTKDLALLIQEKKREYKDVLIVGSTGNTLLHYAFYNKQDPNNIQKALRDYPIKFSNITILIDCPNNDQSPKNFMNEKTFFIAPAFCYPKTNPDYAISASDKSEDLWKIYIKN